MNLTLALLAIVFGTAVFSLGGIAAHYEKLHLLFVGTVSTFLLLRLKSPQNPLASEIPRAKIFTVVALLMLTLPLFQLLSWGPTTLGLLAPLSMTLTFGTISELVVPAQRGGYPISLNSEATLVAFHQILAFIVLLLASMTALRRPEERTKLAHVLVALASLVAIFGLLQKFSGATKIFWLLPRGTLFFGPYVNANHAGALFACIGSLNLLLISRQRSVLGRLILSCSLAILVFGLLNTGSRAAFLSLLIPFGLYLWMLRRRKVRVLQHHSYAIFALTFSAILALAWRASSFSRLGRSLSSLAAGVEFRPRIWGYALELWQQSPFFGVGLGAFSRISPYAVGESLWLHPEHAENDLLELLACGGIVGLILVLPLLFLLVQKCISIFRNADESATRKGFALAIASLAINSLFVFNAPLPAHQILFAILLGGTLASRKSFILADTRVRMACLTLSVSAVVLGAFPVKSRPEKIRAASSTYERLSNEMQHLSADPLEARTLYSIALLSVELQDFERALSAGRKATALGPFELKERIQFSRSLDHVGLQAEALREMQSLLKGHAPMGGYARGALLTTSARLAFALKQDQLARDDLSQLMAMDPEDWRTPLLSMLDSAIPFSHFQESWRRLSKRNLDSKLWDDLFLEILNDRSNVINLEEAAAWLLTVRNDAGLFLERISIRQSIVIDSARLSPRFQANNGPMASASTWRTVPGTMTVPEIVDLKVRYSQVSLDAYLLPVAIVAAPNSLSFRLWVRSARPIDRQMVVESGGKLFISPTPAKKSPDGRWELVFRDVGSVLAADRTLRQPSLITGIGFTPLERDGTYALGPTEIFVDSAR